MRSYDDPEKQQQGIYEATRVVIETLLQVIDRKDPTEYISPSGIESLVNREGAFRNRLCGRIDVADVNEILRDYVKAGLVSSITIRGAYAGKSITGYRPNLTQEAMLRLLAQTADKTNGAKAYHRLGGVLSALQRGQVLWSREEELLVYRLSHQPQYQRRDGSANNALIAEVINKTFHVGNPVRDNLSVGNQLWKYKKALKKGS